MVNNIDHWSIFSTTLFTFFPDSYVTHAAIYFSFQLSFSLVQMQPLEPFQVLQSEDPQVFPYMRISPNLPQNCPRRATTARPGSPSEFNDFSSHLFFINICQQVSSHIAKKNLKLFLIFKPSVRQASSVSSVFLACWCLLAVPLPLSGGGRFTTNKILNRRVGIILTHGTLLIHMARWRLFKS